MLQSCSKVKHIQRIKQLSDKKRIKKRIIYLSSKNFHRSFMTKMFGTSDPSTRPSLKTNIRQYHSCKEEDHLWRFIPIFTSNLNFCLSSKTSSKAPMIFTINLIGYQLWSSPNTWTLNIKWAFDRCFRANRQLRYDGEYEY